MVTEDTMYGALVVDSGPIIRGAGLSGLRNKAKKYFTVPAVLQEIRDAKAREHLDQLPFDLTPREPTPDGIQAVTEFARQTGDYQSLSSVDIQVLGLLYDLEREGCDGDISHIRKTPKRMVGIGKVEQLGTKNNSPDASNEGKDAGESLEETISISEMDQNGETAEEQEEPIPTSQETPTATDTMQTQPKTWAMLVNPKEARKAAEISDPINSKLVSRVQAIRLPNDKESDLGGQFSDAEEDDSEDLAENTEDDDEMEKEEPGQSVEEELASDFPSLAASLHVPYEGDAENEQDGNVLLVDKEIADKKKEEALRPVTNSGKLYNSFKKYGKLMQPKAATQEQTKPEEPNNTEPAIVHPSEDVLDEPKTQAQTGSRIMGGQSMSGQTTEVEDDGEGWITCNNDIVKMKAAGSLNPSSNGSTESKKDQQVGPPISMRCACATTDFAMQNVILQMNLELLSVDGVKVKRLKSWVTRCGACFKVFTESDDHGPYKAKRLFCSQCGSDMIQRVAASVDGKTGRLRLHLSKNYRHNLRGTKFSLPKAGTGDRFQGDLLLREDQLLMGAWNQKVKKLSGGASRTAATSMFGSDLATNVGCHAKSVNQDDIRVGFGRRNPNSSKHGRERRGKKKKKKGSDKACGLRRY